MNNKIAIESLSMDLMRVALGYQRNSFKMADRFVQESLSRITEIEREEIKPYFVKVLDKISHTLAEKETEKIAEDALMFSIRCKNYARKFFNQ